MEIEKKRTCSLAIIITLAIILPIAYFLWAILLNKGTLVLSGKTPFSVDIFFEGKTEVKTNCEESPCKIKQKAGEKMIIISKANYEIFESTVNVERGKETTLGVELIRVPDLQKVEAYPMSGDKNEYTLMLDAKTKMQKLVNAKDKYQLPIVFFPNDIKNPKIFGDEDTVLVVNRQGESTVAYKVNVNTKEKTAMDGNNFESIVNGKWSRDGKYFIYSVDSSGYLWAIGEDGKSKTTEIISKIPQVTWNNNDDLIFTTAQEEAMNGEKDNYGRGKITLKTTIIAKSYLFGVYDPRENSYSRMGRFELSDSPISLVTTGNGKELYFESSKQKYKVELF